MGDFYRASAEWMQHGWTIGTDVALRLCPDDGLPPVRDWLARFPTGMAEVDGVAQEVACLGGVWAYEAHGELWMHSRGEDAFESLSDCASALAEVLGGRVMIMEMPHARSTHRLTLR